MSTTMIERHERRQDEAQNPTTQSSIKALRLNLNLTQSELAKEAGVSRHSIMRQEQLCYPNALPSIVATLSDILGTSESTIERAYLHDVAVNRAQSGLIYFHNQSRLFDVANSIGGIAPVGRKHPFKIWRERICDELGIPTSRIHFSQITSIHPATLNKYEDFKTGFPNTIEVAFKEMGFLPELVEIFHSTPFNIIR